MKDIKARSAIMSMANALYGTQFSLIYIKQLADFLFPPPKKKKKSKVTATYFNAAMKNKRS